MVEELAKPTPEIENLRNSQMSSPRIYMELIEQIVPSNHDQSQTSTKLILRPNKIFVNSTVNYLINS